MPCTLTPEGMRLYYEVSGVGEPLLFIAGRAVDHHVRNLAGGDFAKYCRIIVYDAPGTGQSGMAPRRIKLRWRSQAPSDIHQQSFAPAKARGTREYNT
jgi:pimeloyl-ACP methyl ester carboxylesterase